MSRSEPDPYIRPPHPRTFPIDLKEQLQRTLGTTYTIERELGGGGMSRVFVARDESLGRDVVIKVLAPNLAEGLSIERFTREIRLAAALQEPHIVPVLSAGQTLEGLPYYVMPFVRGESLRKRIAKGPIALDESITILRDVALALAYAHRQGIVHRDIKPENILLSEGTAVVTDFGIAKALQAARTEARGATLTQTGTSLGSPMYMAPEQAAADPSTDQRADIYAWGLVAYELISGKHPFADKTTPQQLLAAHMSVTPRAITAATSNLPRLLAELVMRCLSKDPLERPDSGSDLVAALGVSSTSAMSTVFGVRSRRARTAIVAGIAAVVIIGAGTAWRVRTASAAEPPLIAVLPFDTEGAGSDPGFADGLGDAVSGKLSRLAGLRVIDRKSVLTLASSSRTSAQQAGRSLGAEFVLRASVRWARGANGDAQVRVSPALIRVSDGTTTWAGDPQIVSPADPFAIQASVATRVAEALDVALGARERSKLAARPTADTAAFAAFVLGKRIYDENPTGAALPFRKALEQFELAYRLDPRYSDALGMAARTLARLGLDNGAVLLDSAAVVAQNALSIDPTQADAVGALAMRAFANDRPEDAIALVQRALKENPSNVALLLLQQRIFNSVGDSAGAWATTEHVLPLAPGSATVLSNVFWTAMALRRFEDAAKYLSRWAPLDPSGFAPMFAAAKLAESLGDSAGVARAVQTLRAHGGNLTVTDGDLLRHGGPGLQRELELSSLASYPTGNSYDTATFFGEKATLFRTRGDYARARAALDSGYPAMRHLADDRSQSPSAVRVDAGYLAWFEAGRGNREAALAALRRANANPKTARYPRNGERQWMNCQTAQVYGLLDDVDSMVPYLRDCINLPYGRSPAFLREPEVARHMNDPRVRALASAKPTPSTVAVSH